MDSHTVIGPLQVQKSSVFRRDGADIHSDVMISVAQAILGGTIRAQGLYETVNLAVSRFPPPRPCIVPLRLLRENLQA